MTRPNNFSKLTKELALARQKFLCASCGTRIYGLGRDDKAAHRFGEAAHAHHMRHVKGGGSNSVSNCVVICESCHFSAHEGGNYRRGSVESDESDYPHFWGDPP